METSYELPQRGGTLIEANIHFHIETYSPHTITQPDTPQNPQYNFLK